MLLFYTENTDSNLATFGPSEAQHIGKVLRMKPGDLIHWTDGQGGMYSGEITSLSKRGVQAHIYNKEHWEKTWKSNIHMAICPTKNIQRTEWLVEKLCEMGVDEISLIISHNSERRTVKTEKIQKRIISACTQSLKGSFPKLNLPMTYKAFIKYSNAHCHKYIAHCRTPLPHLSHAHSPHEDALILIGPEGDFTAEEVAQAIQTGWTEIGLGASRLRTETAALVACQTIHILDEMNG